MRCKFCKWSCVKSGFHSNGKQRFTCKLCGKRFVELYTYKAYHPDTNQWIIRLIKEGTGIRSIARLLSISPTTVLKRIIAIASNIEPLIIKKKQTYELDELCTYLGNKDNRIWIAYALNRETKEIVSFNVGRRTNKTLRKISDTLILSNAKKIYTDKLKQYKSLIPKKMHIVKQYGINHIERMNLTLRTHLKRLNRRTICFSKKLLMIVACLKIYFWA